MRRGAILFAAVVVSLTMASGMAIAATIDCVADETCIGTPQRDTINGTADSDRMEGRGGGDTLNGDAGEDEMTGGVGADRVAGGPGDDDFVWGGEQRETEQSFPDKSTDIVSGGEGDDEVFGGFAQGGVDRVSGNDGDDTIIVAQRGTEFGKVTKEIVRCGPGRDTVFRDKGLDQVADNCERKLVGFPDDAARGGSETNTFGVGSS